MFLITSGARYSGVPQSVYVSPTLVSVKLCILRDVLTVLDFLRESKIDQLQMSLGVYEDVLRLQISVCDALALVQEL